MRDDASTIDWPGEAHQALQALQVRQVATIPDAGLSRIIELCRADNAMRLVTLATEEEGIGLMTGAHLGGERSALLMQSSGVGNVVNMLGMLRECRIPALMLVTMRGEWGEFNPWQVPMGLGTPKVFEAMGTVVMRADAAAEVGPQVSGAGRLAFGSYQQVAVLIGQKLIGAKDFRK